MWRKRKEKDLMVFSKLDKFTCEVGAMVIKKKKSVFSLLKKRDLY